MDFIHQDSLKYLRNQKIMQSLSLRVGFKIVSIFKLLVPDILSHLIVLIKPNFVLKSE